MCQKAVEWCRANHLGQPWGDTLLFLSGCKEACHAAPTAALEDVRPESLLPIWVERRLSAFGYGR